jgi:hypothetical protein
MIRLFVELAIYAAVEFAVMVVLIGCYVVARLLGL